MFKLPTLGTFTRDEAEPHPDTAQPDVRSAKRAIPDLRREITFQRRQSERRDNLEPNEPDQEARRALSADRTFRSAPGQPQLRATSSVPSEHPHHTPNLDQLPLIDANLKDGWKLRQEAGQIDETLHVGLHFDNKSQYPTKLPSDPDEASSVSDDARIYEEAEQRWILNLSMRFRDKSDREKFFITFMQRPNDWLRVTVSCDYRECSTDSLEADLKSLYYQRAKSGKIYEAVCDSLPDIQFFPTVTNLKLQTDEGRLHVHVTEDVNEIIEYPAVSLLPYLVCPLFPETEVFFHRHESGFVYGVHIHEKQYIKKEIPGPEAVEEFLYEINALNSLQHSQRVISFEGLVVDDSKEHIKGLVLGFANKGALVDILYDQKENGFIPWPRRLKWASQIVEGLADIHEAGFVQGDFTLSNIVIDSNDDAHIIDINRRGCPVGWEPPELTANIEAGQKISIYIGVKTDVFQMGMVLWALAEAHDEPERVTRPLMKQEWIDVPDWYARAFEACYAEKPQKRPAAKEVWKMFQSGSMHEEDKLITDLLRSSDGPVDITSVDKSLINRRDNEALILESPPTIRTHGQPPQETSHSASRQEPSHVEAGFEDLRDQATFVPSAV